MNPQINKIRDELLKRFGLSSLPKSPNFQPISSTSLASKIDYTNLLPQATQDDINKLCSEAIEHEFYSICIHPSFLLGARKILEQSKVKLVTVVGFPLGTQTTETKVFETLDAIDRGAQEIDMVIHIGNLKSRLMEEVYRDILYVVQQADKIPVKVILETSLLSIDEKIQACILSQIAGAAYVKTSTGFGTSGATVEDVTLLKQVVQDHMGIKASGGIKNLQTAMQMIHAGADRLGTSSGVSIMKSASAKATVGQGISE